MDWDSSTGNIQYSLFKIPQYTSYKVHACVSVLYRCSEWAIAQKQCIEVVMESAINMLA